MKTTFLQPVYAEDINKKENYEVGIGIVQYDTDNNGTLKHIISNFEDAQLQKVTFDLKMSAEWAAEIPNDISCVRDACSYLLFSENTATLKRMLEFSRYREQLLNVARSQHDAYAISKTGIKLTIDNFDYFEATIFSYLLKYEVFNVFSFITKATDLNVNSIISFIVYNNDNAFTKEDKIKIYNTYLAPWYKCYSKKAKLYKVGAKDNCGDNDRFIYYTKENEQCYIGCFVGSPEEARETITRKYKDLFKRRNYLLDLHDVMFLKAREVGVHAEVIFNAYTDRETNKVDYKENINILEYLLVLYFDDEIMLPVLPLMPIYSLLFMTEVRSERFSLSWAINSMSNHTLLYNFRRIYDYVNENGNETDMQCLLNRIKTLPNNTTSIMMHLDSRDKMIIKDFIGNNVLTFNK